ncbi:MAG: hypothetical protein HN617_10690 [Planctomycetaceae bacterium]|jgi:hypothetical protein|nr:hypothetical protein [Planctomycetaceae bacterium]MBT4014240.1 hypothetical protein [Planctomycetaceae bacterium]MBT4724983.1 hypothetical protein [Planctomycetaceae bacterium]MBT4845569.1 hypothetical protein [Planctomycetaceae bacterium]MBT5124614.1 hypothetical protein [Planctomycetaceae bacterium]
MPNLRCHRRASIYAILKFGVGLIIAGCLLSTSTLQAQVLPNEPLQPSAQEQAEHSIPWDKLTATAKTKLRSVISDTTVFHRLKKQQFKCDPSVYIHLVRHPEILTNIWELMGVTQLRIERTAPFSIRIHDGQYTKTKLELVYGTPNLHVFHCEGSYKGTIIPTVSTGRAIIIIRSKYDTAEAALPATQVLTVKHQMDIFLQIDNAADQLLVKTLSYFFMKTADANFSETTQFIGQIDKIVRDNPAGMARLADRLTRVQPAIRQQFGVLVRNANANQVRLATTIQGEPSTTRK